MRIEIVGETRPTLILADMPFTVSHAAAAWPYWRFSAGRLVLPALVIGSMIPDAEYLLRLRPSSGVAHTLPGLVTFCLPTGAIAVWLWDNGVEPELRFLVASDDSAPGGNTRPGLLWAPRQAFGVLVSVLIGAFTHQLLDGCTHASGWAVHRWPSVFARVIPLGRTGQPMYELLQTVTSVIGLLALAFWARPGIARAATGAASPGQLAQKRRQTWALLVVGTSLAATLNVWTRAEAPGTPRPKRVLSFALVGGMAGGALVATAVALGFALRQHLPAKLVAHDVGTLALRLVIGSHQ